MHSSVFYLSESKGCAIHTLSTTTSCSDMPCVAQYSGDMRWQRAKVENLPGHQMVDVKFVDFGNTERLWYHQLYKIMDEFLVLPIQVLRSLVLSAFPLASSLSPLLFVQHHDYCCVSPPSAIPWLLSFTHMAMW